MKTRLLFASIFTVAAAFLFLVSIRTPASAQEDSEGAVEDALVDVSPTEAAAAENTDLPDDGAGVSLGEEEEALPSAEETEAPGGETAEDDGSAATTEADDTGGEGDSEPNPAAEAAAGESEPAMVFDFDEEVRETSVELNANPGTITVDFPDEEIRTILRLVADIFELNLVIPETLMGRASLKLREVTWRQVFDVVLSPIGFTYVEEGNIIKVVSLESLNLEPPVTRVVILDFARADVIMASIQPMVTAGAGGRIQVDGHSNALVITERPTVLRRIEETIKALDTPKVQVMIESKFIETRSRDLSNIGVNWASLDNYGVRAGPFTQTYERERGSSSEDGRDVTSIRDAQQGQNSQSSTTNGGSTSSTTTNSSSLAQDGVNAFDSSLDFSDTTRISSAVFSADQFNVILSALRTTNDVKLVSNPTVVTLDGMPARIHIGDEYPIVRPQFNPETGTYLAGELETIDIGIKLDVTPDVKKAGGFINLEVEPDVSTLSGFVTHFGAEYPIRSTRNAKSFVTIKDGFTLAIGGLVQEDTADVETRVPVLGSIPFLGRLFRSDSKDNDQRNLIIFLTARTLSPDGSTVEETVDPRKIHRMGLIREEIPGYRPNIAMWPEEEVLPQAEEVIVLPPAEPAALELEDTSVEEDVLILSDTVETDGVAESDAEALEPQADGSEPAGGADGANGETDEADAAKEEPALETPAERGRSGGWLTPSY